MFFVCFVFCWIHIVVVLLILVVFWLFLSCLTSSFYGSVFLFFRNTSVCFVVLLCCSLHVVIHFVFDGYFHNNSSH